MQRDLERADRFPAICRRRGRGGARRIGGIDLHGDVESHLGVACFSHQVLAKVVGVTIARGEEPLVGFGARTARRSAEEPPLEEPQYRRVVVLRVIDVTGPRGASLTGVRLLLSALRCEKGAVEENLAEHRRVLGEARDADCGMAVFPEMSLTGSVDPSQTPERLVTLEDPAVAAMTAFTSETGVAAV